MNGARAYMPARAGLLMPSDRPAIIALRTQGVDCFVLVRQGVD